MDLWHNQLNLVMQEASDALSKLQTVTLFRPIRSQLNLIIQKTQSLQILICSLLQAKHLVITQEKNDGLKMVLSYRLQQNVGVELHMI